MTRLMPNLMQLSWICFRSRSVTPSPLCDGSIPNMSHSRVSLCLSARNIRNMPKGNSLPFDFLMALDSDGTHIAKPTGLSQRSTHSATKRASSIDTYERRNESICLSLNGENPVIGANARLMMSNSPFPYFLPSYSQKMP